MSKGTENAIKMIALLALIWSAMFYFLPEFIGWELKRMDEARYENIIDQ